MYCLTFEIHSGVLTEVAEPMTVPMLATIVTSIVLHGRGLPYRLLVESP